MEGPPLSPTFLWGTPIALLLRSRRLCVCTAVVSVAYLQSSDCGAMMMLAPAKILSGGAGPLSARKISS